MSQPYYRRGRNPTTALGVLFIIIGAIGLVRQLILWTETFVLQFLLNSELTSEKVTVAIMGFGVFLVVWGYRKNEPKR